MTTALQRRHRGGLSNFTGNLYESHFAVWRVLVALRALEQGIRTRVAIQLRDCHVDDLVEARGADRAYFQLKRKAKASWREVRSDFVKELGAQRAGTTSVTLVVNSEALAVRLANSRHAVVGANVLCFPAHDAPQAQIDDEPVVRDLVALCALAQPTPVNLETIWFAIDAAWQKARRPGKFVAVEKVVDALLDPEVPVRVAWKPTRAWLQAEKLLAAIPGLSFEIIGGHFFYSDAAGSQGHVSCRTSTFRSLVRCVLQQKPRTIDDFQELV